MTQDFTASTTLDPVLANRLKRNYSSPRTLFDGAMNIVAYGCVAIALVPLAAVLFHLFVQGAARFGPDLFSQLAPAPNEKGGGLGNALIGTLLTVGIGSAIAVPSGIAAAIFLSEFAKGTRLASWIGFFTNVLSGVPSIVVGAFIYAIIVIPTGKSAVAGGVALAVLMLPTIVRTSTESLDLVPAEMRQASVGLGATRFQMVSRVVLPAAFPAILTGVMLAVARASGETAPLIFTAGANAYWSTDVQNPMDTLSVLIYKFAAGSDVNQQQLAWAGSLLLVLMVLAASIMSKLVVKRQ